MKTPPSQTRPGGSRPQPAGAALAASFEEACALEAAERFHDAMRCYRRVLDSDGATAPLCYNLANVLYRLRRKVEAARFYRQAVEFDDRAHEAWNNLGVVLCELRHCADAVPAFERAIFLAPGYADPLYNLADCLDERGEASAAAQYWRAYVKLDPHSPWGAYALERLRA